MERVQDDFLDWYSDFKSKSSATRLSRDEESFKRVQILKLYQVATNPQRLDEEFNDKDIE